jgi:hypothetical protein
MKLDETNSVVADMKLELGRDIHSSTFRLNLSAFCGIGGAFRGYSGVVRWY